jgi:hypothetical protein
VKLSATVEIELDVPDNVYERILGFDGLTHDELAVGHFGELKIEPRLPGIRIESYETVGDLEIVPNA